MRITNLSYGFILAVILQGYSSLPAQLPSVHYLNCDRENQIGLLNARFTQTSLMDSMEVYQVSINLIDTGILVMTGSYTDSTLDVENGYFYYFFANGNPESEGQFSGGIKTGIWKRWDWMGEPKKDRFYPDVIIIY